MIYYSQIIDVTNNEPRAYISPSIKALHPFCADQTASDQLRLINCYNIFIFASRITPCGRLQNASNITANVFRVLKSVEIMERHSLRKNNELWNMYIGEEKYSSH